MVKWIDKVINMNLEKDSSRLKMVTDILIFLFSDRTGNDNLTIRCKGYNERFIELMNEFGFSFWIDSKSTVVYLEKISFLKKFSDKYPLVFSSILMRDICDIYWYNLNDITYCTNNMKESLKQSLFYTILKDDGHLIKYTQREIDDVYKIINNINSKVMGEIVTRQIKTLLKKYTDDEKGMLCLGVSKKFFRNESTAIKYKEKLVKSGFLEIESDEYNEITSNDVFQTCYVDKLINPGDKFDMVMISGKTLYIVRLLKMYLPIFPSMSCFKRAVNVANNILFGSKKKAEYSSEIKFFSFESNRFENINRVPYLRRSTFDAIKPYLTKYVDLIFKYMKEYPFITEADWIFKFLFNFDKEEEIKIVLERMKEYHVMKSMSSSENDYDTFLSPIVNNRDLLTFNMSKKLVMMEYAESIIIYNKINQLLWMDRELNIDIGGNINKKISYALSRDDLDFRLDDIKYSLIKSFCDEYENINIVDAFNFFDNVHFRRNDGTYGWNNVYIAKEKRDIISYMISKKHIEIKQLLNSNLENVRLECESRITPTFLDYLSESLYEVRKRLNLTFDWVNRYEVYGDFRSAVITVLYDTETKTIVLDMRDKLGMIEMHPLCEDWVNNNVANRIYIFMDYSINSRNNIEELAAFIYDPESLSEDTKMYEIYDRNTGFRYKKDICIYDGSNDVIVYYSDGCEYATKKNEMIACKID